MSEEDGGLPEESQNILEQENAVNINSRGPWKINDISIVQNYDDLIEFGNELFSAAKAKKPTLKVATVIVIDNESYTQHYPNNKQFWLGRYEQDTGEFDWKPWTEWLIHYRDNGGDNYLSVADTIVERFNGIQVGTYQGVPIIVPDPNIDHTRPIVQSDATTSTTTGVTVITKTTADPRAAGVVTESETIPADVNTPTELTAEQREWLGGADPNDPYIRARMDAALGQTQVTGGFGNGAAEVAQRIAKSAVASLTTANVSIGPAPCLPNNPPISQGGGSGATPPAAVPYDDAILRQARAAAAAPSSTVSTTTAGAGRGNGAAELAQRRADATTTAPTTVTRTPSTPTSSATASTRPPNVYIYEPLTPGFDRYDFNSGKKVYTPDSGLSRNTASQPVVPQSTPRTPPGANRDPRQTGPF
jgi:hypothetical protein